MLWKIATRQTKGDEERMKFFSTSSEKAPTSREGSSFDRMSVVASLCPSFRSVGAERFRWVCLRDGWPTVQKREEEGHTPNFGSEQYEWHGPKRLLATRMSCGPWRCAGRAATW